DDVVSVEAVAMGPEGRVTKGKANVLKRGEAWDNAHEIHGFKIEGPFPHDDKFICMMEIDVTAKEGPMAGQRMLMKEACHYTVTDGKVSRVEFYYAM
ncbi:MAG: SnoaL-like domain-containing protein, partial [Planctomycetota bacterium]